jgi:ligand-binding SRPBCC domain-containing protein
MTIHQLERETWVPHPLLPVFDFFSKPENLEEITPPWLRFRIVSSGPIQMKPGATIRYALRVHGIPISWLTEIEEWNPPFEFIDRQVNGPYRLWRHTHRFAERDGGTSIVDIVQYALPFGPVGRLVNWLQVARDVSRIFDYRAECIRARFPANKQPGV